MSYVVTCRENLEEIGIKVREPHQIFSLLEKSTRLWFLHLLIQVSFVLHITSLIQKSW